MRSQLAVAHVTEAKLWKTAQCNSRRRSAVLVQLHQLRQSTIDAKPAL
jgi:hypothetical protein